MPGAVAQAEEPSRAVDLAPAGLVARGAARAIDAMVYAAVQVAVGVALGEHAYNPYEDVLYGTAPTGWYAAGTSLLLFGLLELVLVARWGGQLGKLALGLRVVRADGTGPVGLLRSARRLLVTAPPWALHRALGVLVLASAAWGGPQQRGWADRFAGTTVVARSGTGQRSASPVT